MLKIKGGIPLEGTVKQLAQKMPSQKFAASLISDRRCTLYNVPDIAEVEVTIELCQEIGSEVHWDRKEGVIEIVTKELKEPMCRNGSVAPTGFRF